MCTSGDSYVPHVAHMYLQMTLPRPRRRAFLLFPRFQDQGQSVQCQWHGCHGLGCNQLGLTWIVHSTSYLCTLIMSTWLCNQCTTTPAACITNVVHACHGGHLQSACACASTIALCTAAFAASASTAGAPDFTLD